MAAKGGKRTDHVSIVSKMITKAVPTITRQLGYVLPWSATNFADRRQIAQR
jgi:hypothetical protein